MENRNQKESSDSSFDHTAEEFISAHPNEKQSTDATNPQYTEAENQRLDTDPNRYANFPTPDEQDVNREGSPNQILSHYSSEDDRVSHPLVNDNGNPEVQTKKESKDTDGNNQSRSEKDESGFFEGL